MATDASPHSALHSWQLDNVGSTHSMGGLHAEEGASAPPGQFQLRLLLRLRVLQEVALAAQNLPAWLLEIRLAQQSNLRCPYDSLGPWQATGAPLVMHSMHKSPPWQSCPA